MTEWSNRIKSTWTGIEIAMADVAVFCSDGIYKCQLVIEDYCDGLELRFVQFADILPKGNGNFDGETLSTLNSAWVLSYGAVNRQWYVDQQGYIRTWQSLEAKHREQVFLSYDVAQLLCCLSHDSYGYRDAVWKGIPNGGFYPAAGLASPEIGRIPIEPLSGFDILFFYWC
jgi:hypothetical protein